MLSSGSSIDLILARLKQAYRSDRSLFIFRLLVVFSIVALVLLLRIFWTPDVIFLVLFVLFLAFGKARVFVYRFFPLVLLILLYELFRGIAHSLNGNVHYEEMINFDRWMFFGRLPTVELQNLLWHNAINWYDFYFYFLYMLHFLMPLLLAVLIWQKADHYYWRFVWALVGLSFAAFITYLIFPAAPPWMASLDGYIYEPMRRVSSDVWWAIGVKDFSQIYANLPANPVAAVPSLHSAYPLLFTLFITRIWGLRRFWWVYIYPISVWVGVVYLGEHYVIDVILGIIYAVAAYYVSVHFYKPVKLSHVKQH